MLQNLLPKDVNILLGQPVIIKVMFNFTLYVSSITLLWNQSLKFIWDKIFDQKQMFNNISQNKIW